MDKSAPEKYRLITWYHNASVHVNVAYEENSSNIIVLPLESKILQNIHMAKSFFALELTSDAQHPQATPPLNH
jgi:hypothetical protein